MSELLPEGIDDIRDAPHAWFTAVKRALVFLSFDELPKKERPPRRMWLDDDGLNKWFDAVEKRRKEDMAPDGAGPIEDPVENDAASMLIVGE